jgi:hypothetical protein
VICTLGGRRGPLELPESVVDDERPFISGGERTLYELATAAAVLGVDVELRGQIDRAVLTEITGAAGASPRTGLPARRPDAADVVVLPEAIDLGLLAAVYLSEARGVIDLLAPPGLSGWDFLGPEVPAPDHWTVPLGQLGRPESFRVMAGLGFELWTATLGIAAAGRRAGVPVSWLGTGTPVPFPEVPDKTHDVAVIESNRWRRQAEKVADALPGVTVLRIGPVPHVYSMASHLAPARILLWPSRVEGMSRIGRESRAVGTVPVTLDTNPFALPDDHTSGSVLVSDLDEMEAVVRDLLADPGRLAEQHELAVSSARDQVDWPAYLVRVAEVLRRSFAEDGPGVADGAASGTGVEDAAGTGVEDAAGDAVRRARGHLGAAVIRQVDAIRDRSDDLEAHLRSVIEEQARAGVTAAATAEAAWTLVRARDVELERVQTAHQDLERVRALLQAELDGLVTERDGLVTERDGLADEIRAFRNRRAVRWADGVSRRRPGGPEGR